MGTENFVLFVRQNFNFVMPTLGEIIAISKIGNVINERKDAIVMMQKGAVVNKLCCILNPSIICKGCNQHWCELCNPSANGEWQDPKRHQCLGTTWKCPSGNIVYVHTYRASETEILYLEIYHGK